MPSIEPHASLQLTAKGETEVLHRTCKLSIRKRSVLIQLHTPHRVEQIIGNTVYPHDEILEEIEALLRDGFIGLDTERNAAPAVNISAPRADDRPLSIDDEIIVSEAKFLLTDFCVDCFGSESRAMSEEIRACQDVAGLRTCLARIYAATEKQRRDQLPRLLAVIGEINATA